MGSNENIDEYLIENFGEYELGKDEEHTARKGFFVCATFGDPPPFARCFEGYAVTDVQGNEQIEADTFNIAWVSVQNELRRGVGTALITKALQEAKERGFWVARMEVENPQVISVFRKIGQTGLITNVRYALTPMNKGRMVGVVPTAQFDSHLNLRSAAQAQSYLNFFGHAANGMVLDSAAYEVECVMELR